MPGMTVYIDHSIEVYAVAQETERNLKRTLHC